MEPDEWYKADELMDVLGLKATRTKELLRDLVSMRMLSDNGETKGRRYKRLENK